MKRLRNEFDKLIAETEKLFDNVKEEDFEKIENASATCDMMIEQIDKLTTNLETLKGKGESEQLFIAMKRAESQVNSFEDTLNKLDKDNTATEYTFVPDEKLKAILNELQILGKLSYLRLPNIHATKTKDRVISISDQMTKTPNSLSNILVKSSSEKEGIVWGSLVLPNKKILITDYDNKKVKLIDTNKNKIIYELQLPGSPFDITKVTEQEVAVTVKSSYSKTIRFVSVYERSLSKGRNIKLNAWCRGIAYNDKDQTLIVAYSVPSKVEVLDMSGNVIKCLDKNKIGMQLFENPFYVALSPDMMNMYIADSDNHSIILMTINGDVKAEYKDNSLQHPRGICVHKSGLIYVVAEDSVHQLDPCSGNFELLLDKKNGLIKPQSISYCDLEDKLYIGMCFTDALKVFQMK